MSHQDPVNEEANTELPQPKDYRQLGNTGRAILNGVIGDYLAQENNPLAIKMGFYHQQNPILLLDQDLNNLSSYSDKPLTNKVVVLLHGLTNLETIWDFNTGINSAPNDQDKRYSFDHDNCDRFNYGTGLQQDIGFTPLYLRYNSGLKIEKNGQQFAALMNQLIKAYPMPIDELILIGFSMGGLLMRHAQKIAFTNNSEWLSKVTQCFYIGTPHEGSQFERFGQMASAMVRAFPRSYINQWADWIDVRSQGIQDLKEGLAHLNDPRANDSELHSCENGFYYQAQHHFISGSLSPNSNSLVNKMLGDSLVKQPSAVPESIPSDSKQAHFDGIAHIPLAHSPKIYQQIHSWVEPASHSIPLIKYKGPHKTNMEAEHEETEAKLTQSSEALFSGTLAVSYTHLTLPTKA